MIYIIYRNAALIEEIKKLIIIKLIKRVILINIFYNLYKDVKKKKII